MSIFSSNFPSWPIRQFFSYIYRYTDLSTPIPVVEHRIAPKLLTEFPEEILVRIAKNLLPANTADNNWIENLKNFQYACKLFFRLGFVARDAFFLPFFNFDYTIACSPQQKMYAWFEVAKKVSHEPVWAQLDALTMSPAVRPFDIYAVIDFIKNNPENKCPLAMLVELGALGEEEAQDSALTNAQKAYLSSGSAFWSVLKEKPDFPFFKKIPDSFLKIDQYDMLYKAFKSDADIFSNMVKSKVCLHYENPISGVTPFIQAISTRGHGDFMRELSLYVDIHACNVRGENAVHAAAKKGNVEALLFLREQGVDWQKRNYAGHSPIFTAVLHWQYPFVSKLIEYGQAVDVLDKKGNTILMAAITQGQNISAINWFFIYLPAHGMPIHAVNKEGKNILHVLFESEIFKRFVNIIEAVERGSAENIKKNLHYRGCHKEGFLFSGMLSLLDKLLFAHHYLVYIKDKNGLTPFEFLEMYFSKKVLHFFAHFKGCV